jgi:hypothetical protein
VLMSQVAQTAVATAHLTVQARLARWLLMVQDRAGSDQCKRRGGPIWRCLKG